MDKKLHYFDHEDGLDEEFVEDEMLGEDLEEGLGEIDEEEDEFSEE
jgi:hypothetical protein